MFIELTNKVDERVISVNMNHIAAYTENEYEGTNLVVADGSTIRVKENRELVRGLINLRLMSEELYK